MTRRLLVVCTANLCRSPSVERLLQRRLDGLVDIEGHDWVVRSAGTVRTGAAIDPRTLLAARARGLDLSGHTSRFLDREVLSTEGADLVLTMTRAHVRDVVGLDPASWPRAFTLKEIVRRASTIPRARPDEGLTGWLHRVAEGRLAAEMMRPDPIDDIDDPYGAPQREHERMVTEVDALVERLLPVGPWCSSGFVV